MTATRNTIKPIPVEVVKAEKVKKGDSLLVQVRRWNDPFYVVARVIDRQKNNWGGNRVLLEYGDVAPTVTTMAFTNTDEVLVVRTRKSATI